ncbi:hypothetical protein HKX48_003066 [Thoreauomyces humboldtii]|nr:hypothetical protein HKX48_003066 [Thoreauomyces humboldtii]
MQCSTIDPREIKLILTDVDGTLLNDKHELHPRNLAAILNLRKTHPEIPFVISTGKAFAATAHLRKALNLEGHSPAVHANGCVTYDKDGIILRENNLGPGVVVELVDHLRWVKAETFVYCHDHIYEIVVDGRGKDGRSWFDILTAFGENVYHPPGDLMDRVETGDVSVQKLLVFLPAEEAQGLRTELERRFPNQFGVTQALTYALELMPLGSGKGPALEALIDAYKITADNVLAFGDGENDVGMLSTAKYGVSMANAMPLAKRAASYTTVSNEEGGVGASLEAIFKL